MPCLSQRPETLWACALISQLQGIPEPDHVLRGINEVMSTQLQSLHGVSHMPSLLITKVMKKFKYMPRKEEGVLRPLGQAGSAISS